MSDICENSRNDDACGVCLACANVQLTSLRAALERSMDQTSVAQQELFETRAALEQERQARERAESERFAHEANLKAGTAAYAKEREDWRSRLATEKAAREKAEQAAMDRWAEAVKASTDLAAMTQRAERAEKQWQEYNDAHMQRTAERDSLRAEVERLKAHDKWATEEAKAAGERAAKWLKERDEARAEVERLKEELTETSARGLAATLRAGDLERGWKEMESLISAAELKASKFADERDEANARAQTARTQALEEAAAWMGERGYETEEGASAGRTMLRALSQPNPKEGTKGTEASEVNPEERTQPTPEEIIVPTGVAVPIVDDEPTPERDENKPIHKEPTKLLRSRPLATPGTPDKGGEKP